MKGPDSPAMEKELMTRSPSPVDWVEALASRSPESVVSSFVEAVSDASEKSLSCRLTVVLIFPTVKINDSVPSTIESSIVV